MDNGWFSGLALFIYVCVFIAIVIAWADIFLKAGYNRWLCLLMFVPIVNVITFFWFAFSKWPINEFVKTDWRRKLLEDKKTKLEKEISSLNDNSIDKENVSKTVEGKEKETEDQNETEELKEIGNQNERLVTYVLAIAAIVIVIAVVMFSIGGC